MRERASFLGRLGASLALCELHADVVGERRRGHVASPAHGHEPLAGLGGEAAMSLRAALDSFPAFCDAFSIPLFDWVRTAFGEATRRVDGRSRYRVAAVSSPRGNGKSWGAAAVGLKEMMVRPGADVLGCALDLEGAKIMLQHGRTMVRANAQLEEAVRPLANGFIIPTTGSRWTVTSREHTASRGRHPDLVLYDEAGWARDDELFASLLASQASVTDPLMLVVSTVGRRQSGPLWTIKQLAEGGDPDVFWWHTSQNLSPKVTAEFLERQRRLLLPGQYAREHQNSWVDAADGFTSASEIDDAMGHGWTEQLEPNPKYSYEAFVDLGVVSDPTVICCGHLDGGTAYIDKLITFQGSRERPVQLATVEETLRTLTGRFRLRRIRIESWQGMSAAQSLQRLGLPVELFSPTAKAHAEEWPILAQRLANRTLVLPPHARLREELLGLVYEVGPTGIRVIDRGRVHQDHAVAVRGVVAGLQPSRRGLFSEVELLGA